MGFDVFLLILIFADHVVTYLIQTPFKPVLQSFEVLEEQEKRTKRIYFSCKIDVWSFACILAELLSGELLFLGEDYEDQLRK